MTNASKLFFIYNFIISFRIFIYLDKTNSKQKLFILFIFAFKN